MIFTVFQSSQRRLYLGLTMLCLMLLIFFLDSTFISNTLGFGYGQWIANIVTLAYFVWMYKNANLRIQKTMKYGVVIAIAGESFLCLGLGIYEYRLQNVPLYVPLGHAILYTTVWYLSLDPWVIKNKNLLMKLMLGFSVFYTVLLLIIDNDSFGAICTLILLCLLALNPKSRLFFLIMFLAVTFLEQVGTFFECWAWKSAIMGESEWLYSGNPPSGISLGYYVFDGLCLGVYLLRHKEVSKRWRKVGANTPLLKKT